jgi:D-alanyl-D-alanine dipeptidase
MAALIPTPLRIVVLLALLSSSARRRRRRIVDAAAAVHGLVVDMRYFGEDNFVGAHIDGYDAPRCLLARPAAAALAKVQRDLVPQGLGLKVFDCYRPTRAVAHFVRWARDVKDVKRKADFYPDVDKRDLFRLGYIAPRSGHSRGSTVDLTLVRLGQGQAPTEVDMGRALISSACSHGRRTAASARRRRQSFKILQPPCGDAAAYALQPRMVALHVAPQALSGQLFQFSSAVVALAKLVALIELLDFIGIVAFVADLPAKHRACGPREIPRPQIRSLRGGAETAIAQRLARAAFALRHEQFSRNLIIEFRHHAFYTHATSSIQSLTNWLSLTTRSCGSLTLLIRYWRSSPSGGSNWVIV